MDNMLDKCISQGYVPIDCKLDGMLVFHLISSGKNPCDGCNANCSHKINSDCKNIYPKIIEEENKRKRDHNNIMWIDSNIDGVYCTCINMTTRKSYVAKFKNAEAFMVCFRAICCCYHIDTILLDKYGYGVCIMDYITENRNVLKELDIDFIPYISHAMDLLHGMSL